MPESSSSQTRPAPLAGVLIVEICSVIAGPACGRMLADFGADVIKIEPPDGDLVRQFGSHVGDVSLYAASILRNKQSISLDLKTAQGQAIAAELLKRADVLIENNRPGVLERLGLGWETLSAANPRLIMVRISGYGQTGPYSERPGYGAICEAVGGVRHMTGDPDRPPSRVALATTDYLSATYAAFGATMAILERMRSGQGQLVDVALYETAFTQMEPHVVAYEKLGTIPQREGANLPSMAPNSLYPTRDGGWVLLAAASNLTFERLLRAMGRVDLLQVEQFATVRARGNKKNMKALDAIIAEWTRQFDAKELEDLLVQAQVPSARAYTIADIYTDPHYEAREMLVRVEHPQLGHTIQPGIVPKLSASPGSIRRTGPELGADGESILRERLQWSEDAIAAARADGALHGASGTPRSDTR
ncbi:MAG: CaiB/BaiF CoA transferase family protein [Bradyrhizobium sp.]|uniref:CaiB/BaiF CoA transferase family protein n=1 Tax=Bradyrhizobium sp. TaxID=376 RepID=UPI003D0B9DEC